VARTVGTERSLEWVHLRSGGRVGCWTRANSSKTRIWSTRTRVGCLGGQPVGYPRSPVPNGERIVPPPVESYPQGWATPAEVGSSRLPILSMSALPEDPLGNRCLRVREWPKRVTPPVLVWKGEAVEAEGNVSWKKGDWHWVPPSVGSRAPYCPPGVW